VTDREAGRRPGVWGARLSERLQFFFLSISERLQLIKWNETRSLFRPENQQPPSAPPPPPLPSPPSRRPTDRRLRRASEPGADSSPARSGHGRRLQAAPADRRRGPRPRAAGELRSASVSLLVVARRRRCSGGIRRAVLGAKGAVFGAKASIFRRGDWGFRCMRYPSRLGCLDLSAWLLGGGGYGSSVDLLWRF